MRDVFALDSRPLLVSARRLRPRLSRFDALLLAALRHRRRRHHPRRAPAGLVVDRAAARHGRIGRRRRAHLLDGHQDRREGARALRAREAAEAVPRAASPTAARSRSPCSILIPPPFPFTPFVLAAGALKVKARPFFVTLGVCRLLRFGLEAALALIYGRRIMAWLDSDLFHDIVLVVIVLRSR